jgi:spore coat protein U-like protein
MRGLRWLVTLVVLGGALIVAERPASAQWCSFGTTSVSFGAYDVFSTVPLASTGSVTYRCRNMSSTPQPITVWLGKGRSPTNNPRQMSSGVGTLNYNLYLDAAHTLIWGDPNPGDFDGTIPAWSWGTTRTVTVYGLVPAGQDVPAGTYTDTVVVTFQF